MPHGDMLTIALFLVTLVIGVAVGDRLDHRRPRKPARHYPKLGWYCYGKPGHKGPCAAWPVWWRHPVYWFQFGEWRRGR